MDVHNRASLDGMGRELGAGRIEEPESTGPPLASSRSMSAPASSKTSSISRLRAFTIAGESNGPFGSLIFAFSSGCWSRSARTLVRVDRREGLPRIPRAAWPDQMERRSYALPKEENGAGNTPRPHAPARGGIGITLPRASSGRRRLRPRASRTACCCASRDHSGARCRNALSLSALIALRAAAGSTPSRRAAFRPRI